MSLASRVEARLVISDDTLPEVMTDFVVAVGCTLAPGGRELSPQTAVIAQRALELWRAGKARRLIALGSGYHPGQMPCTEAELIARFWLEQGIPSGYIIEAGRSYNTRQNAEELRDTLEQIGIDATMIIEPRMIVVAQQLHARRVKLAFRKVLGPDFRISVVKAPSPYGGSSKWFLNTFWAFLIWDTLSLAYFKVRGWI